MTTSRPESEPDLSALIAQADMSYRPVPTFRQWASANEFIDKTYLELSQTVKPADRQRLARAIGDHLFEEFADIPLFWFANEVVANPKVVGEWVYPGIGAGRSTHFGLIKSAR